MDVLKVSLEDRKLINIPARSIQSFENYIERLKTFDV